MSDTTLTPAEPEVVTPAEPAAEPAPQAEAADPAVEAAAETQEAADVFDAARKLFYGDADPDEESLKLGGGLSGETIAKWDSTVRGEVKGLVGRLYRERADLLAKQKEAADAVAKREAELTLKQRQLERERAAHRQSIAEPETIRRLEAKVAARPAKVDPNDHESILAELSARAAEAELEARRPSIAAADAEARRIARDEAMVRYGLDPSKDLPELNERMRTLYGNNEALVEAAKAAVKAGRPEAAPIHIVAQMISAERKAAAVRDIRAAEAADRSRAAATMATTTRPNAGKQPSHAEYIAAREKEPDFEFTAAYRTDPRYKAAIDHMNANQY